MAVGAACEVRFLLLCARVKRGWLLQPAIRLSWNMRVVAVDAGAVTACLMLRC